MEPPDADEYFGKVLRRTAKGTRAVACAGAEDVLPVPPY
jgi:hypothetical protein